MSLLVEMSSFMNSSSLFAHSVPMSQLFSGSFKSDVSITFDPVSNSSTSRTNLSIFSHSLDAPNSSSPLPVINPLPITSSKSSPCYFSPQTPDPSTSNSPCTPTPIMDALSPIQGLRRRTRRSIFPSYLSDFVCDSAFSVISLITSILSLHSFFFCLSKHRKPTNFTFY